MAAAQLPDPLWDLVEPFLPTPSRRPKGGLTEFWPGIPVIPIMSTGASDGRFLRNIGIPVYGTSGLASDIDDVRAHGKDERVLVKSFYLGQEYLYRLVKLMSFREVMPCASAHCLLA
jgi:acetylornithine deacetylase/succinyl-diaminopimelate desuccinylase-like protein